MLTLLPGLNSPVSWLKGLSSDNPSIQNSTALLLVLWFFSLVFIQPSIFLADSAAHGVVSPQEQHRIVRFQCFMILKHVKHWYFLPLSISFSALLDLVMALNSISTVLPISLNYFSLSEVLQLCLMKVNCVTCKQWLCTAHCSPGDFYCKYFISHLSRICFFPH